MTNSNDGGIKRIGQLKHIFETKTDLKQTHTNIQNSKKNSASLVNFRILRSVIKRYLYQKTKVFNRHISPILRYAAEICCLQQPTSTNKVTQRII